MMFKRLLIVVLTMGLIVAFSLQSATATDPKWREKQEALFKQTGLKPGEIIKSAEWGKVKDLLPPSIVGWLKKGYLPQIKIGEFMYDPSIDDEWIEATRKNAGKYKLDKIKNLEDATTGKPPLWVYGEPFPDVDVKNDPDAGIKIAYNQTLSAFRAETLWAPFYLEWIGKGGFERMVECRWIQYLYWGREKPVPNPKGYRFLYLTGVIKPYDVAGINHLTFRKVDGTPDDFYIYIPAIRRIKKMSGANRSDPYVGSDAIVDDGGGFAGLTNSMKWRFLGEKVGLMCIEERDAARPRIAAKLPGGGWKIDPGREANVVGHQVKGWKGAPWAPVNATWVPRHYYIIEATPLDPYYNSGKNIYWIEKESKHISYKIVYDKAGEYWKTINFLPCLTVWGDKRGYHAGGTAGYQIYDEKSKHATRVSVGWIELDTPKVTPEFFTIERLRTVTK